MEESMLKGLGAFRIAILGLCILFAAIGTKAQSAGTIEGEVEDPSGAGVPGATVVIHDPVSGFDRTAVTDTDGKFAFTNVPFNPYHMTVTAPGFAVFVKDVELRSAVPESLTVKLKIGAATQTVTVEASGGDLIENTSTFHTDVDQQLIEKLPLESQSSSVSSLVTLTTPGVAADSNGLFHGLGDHASNSFSVDGQPITDQQSKVFSNQIPSDSIQSLEVISGAPPAEYGDKTSLVIKVTTKSGLGITKPTGTVTASYGSFGTASGGFDLAWGSNKLGNYVSVSGLNTGRFLDPPEFTVIHAKGNQQNLFDRVDYQASSADTIHLDLGYTRSWFQTPNAFDNLHTGQLDPFGNPLGPTDQRSKIGTFNIAPSWTRLFGTTSAFTLGAFVRRDHYFYYPSGNPFADLSPLQSESIGQDRTLTNAGIRSEWSYVKGIHNIKAGAVYEHTFLTENDSLGIVDPAFLPSLADANGNPCLNSAGQPIAAPCTTLAPYDFTMGGNYYRFRGHTDVKELALYFQDEIRKNNWSFNLGVRGDLYNGITSASQAEPRLGIAYNIKPTNTVLQVSYARTLETPFNENLVLASSGCNDAVVNALMASLQGYPCLTEPLSPGWRNEFHAGFQQAFGKYMVVDAEYIWKYTHLAYDFSILGSTPITFPIEWHNSKVPGYAIRASVPDFHGFTALVVMSSVAARFFQPQVSGIGATPAGQGGNGVFRIDHDEKFNQTTHLQYQPWKRGPWFGLNWRYDSGLVAGAVPFAVDTTTPVDLTGLSADQQMQAGLFCGNQFPTLTTPLTTCAPSQYGSTRISIPAPGTQNDDHNPPRIAARHLFDVSVGDDNLFHGDRYKWSLQFTVINLMNKVALYNFLSTFSGTHFVTPRTETLELGFHF
jgi:Carboxypeptidase regulatory-like domain/TonB-dependent Receptor Plug Domain